MWLLVIFQIGVPLLLLGVIAISRQPNRLRWSGTVVPFGMVTLYLLVSSRWEVTTLYLKATPWLAIGFTPTISRAKFCGRSVGGRVDDQPGFSRPDVWLPLVPARDTDNLAGKLCADR